MQALKAVLNAIRCGIVVVAVSSLGGHCLAADELSPEKRADIERLLAMTGAASIGKQMAALSAAHMALAIRQNHPSAPQKALDALPEEVGAVFDAHIGSFVAAIIPVYHRHFTAEEIKGMIGFYSSALGRKAISVMPGLVSESMQLGQQWGQSLGQLIAERVKARMKKEGIDL